jgi:hypothetical protein
MACAPQADSRRCGFCRISLKTLFFEQRRVRGSVAAGRTGDFSEVGTFFPNLRHFFLQEGLRGSRVGKLKFPACGGEWGASAGDLVSVKMSITTHENDIMPLTCPHFGAPEATIKHHSPRFVFWRGPGVNLSLAAGQSTCLRSRAKWGLLPVPVIVMGR